MLDPAGYPLTSANNILVLGSDRRQKNSKEPGAETTGPGRSDTIMLIRTGGGHAARLSIPRDTVRRNPRPRPAEDQRRPCVRRARAVDLGDQGLARHPDQPPGGSELRKLPPADRRDGRGQLHRRLHRLAPGRRLQPGRLHAAAERRHPPPQRQAGAGAGPHPREPVRPQRDRPAARGTPAGAVHRHEEPPALARRASCVCPGSPGTPRRRSSPT